MKDESDRKIMTKFVGLGAKAYRYLIDDGSEDKKAKGTWKCVIKRKVNQRFKSERRNVFTKVIKKIDNLKMMIKANAINWLNRNICIWNTQRPSNIIKRSEKWLTLIMFQKKNIKEHHPNWSEIPDHSYRILIIRGSGSGITNTLFNMINQEPDIEKIYLYTKDL